MDKKEMTQEEYDKFIFKRRSEEYEINLNPMKNYVLQASTFLSKSLGIDKNEAIKLTKTLIKESGAKNPIVEYRYRKENGDVEIREDKITDYIKEVLDNSEVLVPSFTSYIHPSKQRSLHADFLDINIQKRKKDKENMFKYKQLGDMDKFIHYNTLQKVRKIFNNSLSGAYASKSTILHNPSAHYTLTSMTRSVASIGNAISESIIAGNKYFRSPEIAINYIIAIVSNIHINTVEYAMEKYKLHYPTPQEVMDMILYSSRNYWMDKEKEAKILEFLETLTKVELAAVMYLNDLFHMKKHNEKFVYNMLTELSRRVETGSTNHLRDIKNTAEGVMNLVHHICADDIKGMDVKYDKLVGTKTLEILASTAKNVMRVLQKYKVLFRAFFVTDILPIDIAYIKDMLRDAIVLSDTDSTCGSYDKWVEWYFGHPKFTADAIALSAAVMTINTQAMDHNLKVFARNMNVDKSLVEHIKMKNEFYWSVFTASNVSKHYFANTAIQEGNVYKEPDLELKGVHLIASSVDQSVVKVGHDLLKEINATVTAGKKLNMYNIIKKVADVERELIDRVYKGDIEIYKKDKIKEAGSYKLSKENSPFINHMLWESVFSEKYGTAGEPTYMVIKVPLTIKSKKDMDEFVENIKDKNIKVKFQRFLKKYKKDVYGTFRPPLIIVKQNGLPEEIKPVINVKRIVTDNCNLLYIMLESIGFYRKNDLLVSEMGY